ncbi:MAG: hypothetical protein AB7I01_09415 [Gammaproteobacteria bacterium]
MRVRRLLAQGTLLALLHLPTVALAAAGCALADERRALDVRVLQTRLMVAALACGYHRDYNHIVTDLRPLFAQEAGALRGYFRRRFGRGGQVEMDRFVTRLANEESQHSNADRGAYCAARRVLVGKMRTAGGRALGDARIAADLTAGHRIALCGTDRAVSGGARSADATPR